MKIRSSVDASPTTIRFEYAEGSQRRAECIGCEVPQACAWLKDCSKWLNQQEEAVMDKPEVVVTQPIQGPIEPPKGLTVGRNCHYVTSSGRHLAAIITDVTDRQAGIVSLIAFDPELGYSPHKYGVRYDPLNPTYDTWHYIEPVID